MATFYGKCLWIEKDVRFQNELLEGSRLAEEYPCITARNLYDGLTAFNKNKSNIRIIFISGLLIKEFKIEAFREISDVPIILIKHGTENSSTLINLERFDQVIEKPKSYAGFVDIIKEKLTLKYNWGEFQASAEEKFVELQLEDKKYISTPIDEFVLTAKSYFNIHIRLGSSRYIKILNAGDEIKKEFLDTYSEKGITHLYIPITEHEKYLTVQTKISERSVRSFDAKNDIKVKSILNLGSNVANNLLQSGISVQKMDHAEAFLNQTVSVIRSMRIKNDSLKKFIEQFEGNNHCATVSFLAGIIANEMGFESSKSVKLVGVAAMFHDIGLYDLDPNFESEALLIQSPEKIEIFQKHAKHGADLLRKAGTFEEVSCLAVEQHHLRRKGDDSVVRSNHINLVTEIISVADDFHNILIEGGFSAEKELFFMQNQLKNFSPGIEKTMLRILKSKKAA